jgi:hypothetical protein
MFLQLEMIVPFATVVTRVPRRKKAKPIRFIVETALPQRDLAAPRIWLAAKLIRDFDTQSNPPEGGLSVATINPQG